MSIAENRKKLCEALRSGKYKQGTGSLRTSNDHYCCLGVACDLADDSQWDSRFYKGSKFYPPESVDALYGFDQILEPENLLVGVREYVFSRLGHGAVVLQNVLASLNDSGLYDFAQIADVIEALPIPEEATV